MYLSGIQGIQKGMDPRLHGDDKKGYGDDSKVVMPSVSEASLNMRP